MIPLTGKKQKAIKNVKEDLKSLSFFSYL